MGHFTLKTFLYVSILFFQTLFIIYLLTPSFDDTYNTSDNQLHSLRRLPCLCFHGNKHNDSTLSPKHINETFINYSSQKREHVYLLVVIISSPKGRERRQVIRETWANTNNSKLLHSKVKVKFSIGIQGLHKDALKELYYENSKYHDLILLENMVESYHNLTLKVLQTFVHVIRNFNITYLFKGDDDTFVLLDVIVKELMKRDIKNNLSNNDLNKRLDENRDLSNNDLSRDLYSPLPSSTHSYYWGFFNGKARVKRTGKWTEKEWFLSSHYLPYALGGGYIISGDLVSRIVINVNGLQLYHSEDVSVGVWLSPFKIERKHDVRFNTQFVSRGCRNVYIVSHKQSIDDMRSKYDNLLRFGSQCLHEYQTRLSYVYNWSVPPLECCQLKEGIP